MSGISASFFGQICPTFCRKNRKSRRFCQKSAQVFVKNADPAQEMKVFLKRISPSFGGGRPSGAAEDSFEAVARPVFRMAGVQEIGF
jgi:hypothetical protein